MNDMAKNKTVVVTGAGRGIGLAIAEELSRQGARVVGAARTVTDDLAAAAEVTLAVDLSTPDGPGQVIELALERFGGIDVLVNNVGAFAARTDGFTAISDADWRYTFEVNFFSAVRAIRSALPSLIDHGGMIINVSSVNAKVPQPLVVDYAAAKAALTNLGRSLADELGPQGVHVATVSPGPTRTPAWQSPDGFGASLAEASNMPLEEFLEAFPAQAGLATGRFTEPAEVAALVAFLASDHVRSAHGADWLIDGGQAKQT